MNTRLCFFFFCCLVACGESPHCVTPAHWQYLEERNEPVEGGSGCIYLSNIDKCSWSLFFSGSMPAVLHREVASTLARADVRTSLSTALLAGRNFGPRTHQPH